MSSAEQMRDPFVYGQAVTGPWRMTLQAIPELVPWTPRPQQGPVKNATFV